ncbi:Gfo/Idh/MocA family oxidoreductase [Kiritimatiellota bacterium B12222]|nr:Gfo/Idh/MocA family oxidoreductase [Kiritimatiellota bacterium B12222]
MKKFKAIHVGCGGIADSWFTVTKNHPNIEWVGIVDLDVEVAKAKARQFGLPVGLATSDLEKCLRESGADLVFDCTVPSAHKHIVLSAVGKGCHVLGEKPLAESMADAREMVKAAQEAGVTYGVMQNRRWQPNGIQRVRAALDSGMIGQAHTFHSDFFIGAHFGGFRDEMKHVLLFDMAIHSFDQIRYLTDAPPVKVWAQDWNPPGSWYADGASAVAFFEHEDQIRSSYRGSWCAEGLSTSWQCQWRILGTKGSLMWDGEDGIEVEQLCGTEGLVRDCVSIPVPEVDANATPSGHEAGILNFLQSLCEGTQPATPAYDNFHSLAMVHGAIASAESGESVCLSSLG